MSKSSKGDILIVDDQLATLKVLTSILTEQGYRVRQAISGPLALKAVQKSPPDLILLDILMPDMDGYEVIERLKADEGTRDIPIIFISVLCDIQDKVKGFAAGGVDYVARPFQEEEVLARVETHLALRAMRKQLEEKNARLEQEITERKKAADQIQASLAEKEVLLREIHHRVKNNMQVITSLLNLQEEYIDDEKYSGMFQDSKNRIVAMALVHDKLYQSENLANVNFPEYISSLASTLFQTYRTTGNIALKMDVEEISLSIDSAIPCGLILNELISNSLKHAFPDNRDGEIRIDFHSDNDGNITLIVGNNGVEFPEDLDWKNTESLGLQLVNILTQQLDGTIELDRTGGTAFKIRWYEERI